MCPRSPRHRPNELARRPNVAMHNGQLQLDGAGRVEPRGVKVAAIENAPRLEFSVGHVSAPLEACGAPCPGSLADSCKMAGTVRAPRVREHSFHFIVNARSTRS